MSKALVRFVSWFTLTVFSSSAWAEGAGPTSPDVAVNLVKDYGGWGLSTLFAGVILTLWLRDGKKDEEIRALNKSLVEAVGTTMKAQGENTAALKSLEDANRATSGMNTDRWDSVKSMSMDLVRVVTGVSGNRDMIQDLKTTVEGLRQDIQNLRIRA